MRDDVLRNWKHLRAEVHFYWRHLTADDLDGVDGDRQRLVGVLETRLGLSKTCAERELDVLVSVFEARLRRAS
jgi:hypothetical protein